MEAKDMIDGVVVPPENARAILRRCGFASPVEVRTVAGKHDARSESEQNVAYAKIVRSWRAYMTGRDEDEV